jgi:hypothetical protein
MGGARKGEGRRKSRKTGKEKRHYPLGRWRQPTMKNQLTILCTKSPK